MRRHYSQKHKELVRTNSKRTVLPVVIYCCQINEQLSRIENVNSSKPTKKKTLRLNSPNYSIVLLYCKSSESFKLIILFLIMLQRRACTDFL